MLIGERLRAIRESKNLSQGDIEKRTGLLRCYVSRCENGHTVPAIDTLEKWSKALEISMAQLFADNGHEPKPLPLSKSGNGNTPKLRRSALKGLERLHASFAHMNDKDIAIVVGIAGKFAQRG
ncbi:MAG: helix-turn-helix domain-containing protein [Candidatus Acidiferrales bacterium]